MNRSVIDSGQVGHKIVFNNIWVQAELIQMRFKQVNSVNVNTTEFGKLFQMFTMRAEKQYFLIS